MFSEQMYDFQICDAVTLHVDMNTENLAPGQYSVDVVAFSKDAYHNDKFIDGVYPGFMFELSSKVNSVNKINWIHRYWGYTRLTDLRVKDND